MGMEQVTFTFSISAAVLGVGATLVAIIIASVLVWSTLPNNRSDTARNPRVLLTGFGWVLSPIWLILLAATLWRIFEMLIVGTPSFGGSSLGAGALIVALLGAPFLIWSTVLKHETVRYQKEGLITDRINKAVEQLGVEKTVERRGRTLFYTVGITKYSAFEYDDVPFNYPPNATEKKRREWVQMKVTQPNIEVRIGAILSLERIAQDSTNHDQGRDHVRVMEILCAYIRQNAPATTAQNYPEPDWELLADDATDDERRERFGSYLFDSKAWQWAQTLPPPRADIALALKVLGRRTATQRQVEAAWPNLYDESVTWPFDAELRPLPKLTANTPRDPAELDKFKADLGKWQETLRAYSGYRLDLRGTNLQGADLSSERPDRSDAVFSGAKFHKSCLAGANLNGARLEGALFDDARLEGASLRSAQLTCAEINRANFESARLWLARMDGVNGMQPRMDGATLLGAVLNAITIREGYFVCADLRGASMEGAFMDRTDLKGANLAPAHFLQATLRNVYFDTETKWDDTQMQGTSLAHIDFSDTPISAAQIAVTFGDGSTILPEDMARPRHWPQQTLEWSEHGTEYRKWLSNPDTYTPPL